MVLGPVAHELLVSECFGAPHERHHLHAGRGLAVGSGAFGGDHPVWIHPPDVDAPGDRVQRVSRGNVVDVVRARQPERDERIAVRDEARGIGLARVLTLIGLGEVHGARHDRLGRERFGRPRIDDLRGQRVGRDGGRPPDRNEEMLGGHGVPIHTSPSR